MEFKGGAQFTMGNGLFRCLEKSMGLDATLKRILQLPLLFN